MAEFSKQYVQGYDPMMGGWDFDIDKEFEKVSGGEYLPIICEGFGFVAICKQLDESKWCVFRNWVTGETNQVRYEDVRRNTYKDIWK